MDNYSNIGIAAAAGQMGQIQRAIPVTTSLEQRLDHLCRGVERLCKVRAALESIAERLSTEAQNTGIAGANCPPCADLSGRFGDSIGHVHNNIDTIEVLVNRIAGALFDSSREAQQAKRA